MAHSNYEDPKATSLPDLTLAELTTIKTTILQIMGFQQTLALQGNRAQDVSHLSSLMIDVIERKLTASDGLEQATRFMEKTCGYDK